MQNVGVGSRAPEFLLPLLLNFASRAQTLDFVHSARVCSMGLGFSSLAKGEACNPAFLDLDEKARIPKPTAAAANRIKETFKVFSWPWA